jgi:hypothetical protein
MHLRRNNQHPAPSFTLEQLLPGDPHNLQEADFLN